eukprot:456862_1
MRSKPIHTNRDHNKLSITSCNSENNKPSESTKKSVPIEFPYRLICFESTKTKQNQPKKSVPIEFPYRLICFESTKTKQKSPTKWIYQPQNTSSLTSYDKVVPIELHYERMDFQIKFTKQLSFIHIKFSVPDWFCVYAAIATKHALHIIWSQPTEDIFSEHEITTMKTNALKADPTLAPNINHIRITRTYRSTGYHPYLHQTVPINHVELIKSNKLRYWTDSESNEITFNLSTIHLPKKFLTAGIAVDDIEIVNIYRDTGDHSHFHQNIPIDGVLPSNNIPHFKDNGSIVFIIPTSDTNCQKADGSIKELYINLIHAIQENEIHKASCLITQIKKLKVKKIDRKCVWYKCDNTTKNVKNNKLYKCKRCLIVGYCSRLCQKRDWNSCIHKTICHQLIWQCS